MAPVAEAYVEIRSRVKALEYLRRDAREGLFPYHPRNCYNCLDEGWTKRATPDPKRKFPWWATEQEKRPPGPHYEKCSQCDNPKGKARP